MKSWKIRLQRAAFAIVGLCVSVFSAASQNQTTDSSFGFHEWIYDNTVFPYREAVIAADGAHSKLVLFVYLHGGPKRGSDNVSQMTEEAIYVIANYLRRNCIHAIMIVPQCPDSLTWGVRTNEAIKALVDEYVEEDKVDSNRIYLLGGSMGGTGTWLMTSAYPNLFAAAMPVAGNPETADASLVANTPVYAVMGTEDNLMTIPRVCTFMEQLKERGGEALLDIEKGWSHVKTCTDSYTDERESERKTFHKAKSSSTWKLESHTKKLDENNEHIAKLTADYESNQVLAQHSFSRQESALFHHHIVPMFRV